ncbi:hypothetical protein F4809DRAFT_661456 [Biscogniauxia mediterranea]|nr:hypothetical protein F4809DRAFT_661456 [Biscogniauxia mediterranea]
MFGMGDLQAAKELQNSFTIPKPIQRRNKKPGGARNRHSYQAPSHNRSDYGNGSYLDQENQDSYPWLNAVDRPGAIKQDTHAERDSYTSRQFEAYQQAPYRRCEQDVHGLPSRRPQNTTYRPPWQGPLVTSESNDAACFWSPPPNPTPETETSHSMPASNTSETTPAVIDSQLRSSHASENLQSCLPTPLSKADENVKGEEEDDLIDFSEPSQSICEPIPSSDNPMTEKWMQNHAPNQYNIDYPLHKQALPARIPSQEFLPHDSAIKPGRPLQHASTRQACQGGPEDIQMGGMDTTSLPPTGAGLGGSSWNPQNNQGHRTYADVTMVDNVTPSRRPPSGRIGPVVTSGISRGQGLASSRWCDAPDLDEEL